MLWGRGGEPPESVLGRAFVCQPLGLRRSELNFVCTSHSRQGASLSFLFSSFSVKCSLSNPQPPSLGVGGKEAQFPVPAT